MTVYIVWVNPAMGYRYIDSMWAEAQRSNDRQKELRASMAASGNPETGNRRTVYAQIGEVADAALVPGAPRIQRLRQNSRSGIANAQEAR